MPGGYHNDQFFNLNKAGEDTNFLSYGNGAGFAVVGADNPPFSYPDRTIRTTFPNGSPTTSVLKRGYIRSLVTYSNGINVPIRKCQFQFNPSTLTQSVQSNTSMLNFLQMDPAQYAQPMPSNVNFTFDLLFDRSMEVNNSDRVAVADPVNAWEQNDPGQVGVLRDLAAFFGVIGQGLSGNQVEYITKVIGDQITAETNALNIDATTETQVNPSDKISAIPQFLELNAANSAFLLPLPVRVVFSSLYIVEGLVTNSTVTFTKFSSTMVPMQCAVSITMEAKYIGFAKKNTFLTYVLEEREKREAEQLAAQGNRVEALYAAFGTMARSVQVNTLRWDGTSTSGGDLTLENLLASNQPASVMSGFVVPAYNATRASDAVVRLYDNSGDPISVQVNSQLTVYGPFDNLSSYVGQSGDKISTKVRSLGSPSVYQAMIGQGFQNSADSADSWRRLVDGHGSHPTNPLGNQLGVYRNTGTYNSAKYYVTHGTSDMTVRFGGNSTMALGSHWTVIPPNSGSRIVRENIPMTWPSVPADPTSTYSTSNTTPSSVPADNKATTTPAPGASSSVGYTPRNAGPR